MATRLPLLILLAALGGLAWVALGGVEPADVSSPEGTSPAEEGGRDAPPPGARREAPSESPPALEGPARDPVRRPPRPPGSPVVYPDRLPRGALEVLPLRPDGQPYPVDDLRVTLEGVERPLWSQPLGLRDPESRLHRFEDVVAGEVRVRITGDHVVETTKVVTVWEGETTKVRVPLDRAGAIRYAASLYSGEAPEALTLTLLERTAGRPVSARYQARSERVLTAEREAREITLPGPSGAILGVAAGRYVLRATSPAGQVDEVDLDVRLGETTEVELRLRY